MSIESRWDNKGPNLSKYFETVGRVPTPQQIRKPATRLTEGEEDLIDRYLVKFYLSFEWLELSASSPEGSTLSQSARPKKASAEALLTEFSRSGKQGHKLFLELYEYIRLRFGDLNKLDHEHFFKKASDGTILVKRTDAIPPPRISSFRGLSTIKEE